MSDRTTIDLLALASRIATRLWEAEGEVTDEIAAELHALDLEGGAKVEALWHVYRRLRLEAKVVKAERARLKSRLTSIEASRDRVKALALELLLGMRELGLLEDDRRIKTSTFTAWLQRTTRLEAPDDLSRWPRVWIREKTIREPNRAMAKEDLESAPDRCRGSFALVDDYDVRFR